MNQFKILFTLYIDMIQCRALQAAVPYTVILL